MKITVATIRKLLQKHSQILDQLRDMGVVRTNNNPVGGYTEWLVCAAMGLNPVENSNKGFDAESGGVRYEIKGRRITKRNPSTLLGAIRDFTTFDCLVAVLFNEDYSVKLAMKFPSKVVRRYAGNKVKNTNAFRVLLQGKLLIDQQAEDITELLKSFSNSNKSIR